MGPLDQISASHLRRLVQVAQRITAEHDIAKLCETILEQARDLTNADGGTLYLAEGHGASQRLEFAIVRNRSLDLTLGGSSGRGIHYPALPMYLDGEQNHRHVATHAGLSAELVNIADIYAAAQFDFSGARDFDRRFDYSTRSILTVPLLTDFGELVAVMQLINACEQDSGQVVPFSQDMEPLVSVLASFAAVALQQQRVMHDQKELLIALSGEPNTGRLVERILTEAQAITHADGGTLYLYRDDGGPPRLEFALVRNDSLRYNLGGSSGEEIDLAPVPLYLEDGKENHHHVAAHAALTGKMIKIADAYQSEAFDFSGTKAFDRAHGYHSVSFLTIPLLNHLDEVIGVLQLVNAIHPYTRRVTRFSSYVEPLARALAGYAAIALNNLILVQELKDLLDAFIKVIAKAIDAKSPHTSRHCQRVPLLTELMVRAACDDRETFQDFQFDEDGWYELRVAAWLHDCGKLSTPDSVLDKSTKLHTLDDRIEWVAARFAALRQHKELETLRAIAAEPKRRAQLEGELRRTLAQLEEDLAFLRRVNAGGEVHGSRGPGAGASLGQAAMARCRGPVAAVAERRRGETICASTRDADAGRAPGNQQSRTGHHRHAGVSAVSAQAAAGAGVRRRPPREDGRKRFSPRPAAGADVDPRAHAGDRGHLRGPDRARPPLQKADETLAGPRNPAPHAR